MSVAEVTGRIRDDGQRVQRIVRIFPPTRDGYQEVLFLEPMDVPLTAYVHPDCPTLIASGW